jgi:hypothetical protein
MPVFPVVLVGPVWLAVQLYGFLQFVFLLGNFGGAFGYHGLQFVFTLADAFEFALLFFGGGHAEKDPAESG